MTKTCHIRAFAVTAAFMTFAAAAMMSQTASARAAASTLSCDGTSRRSVIECCETLVRKNGTPLWMKREGKSCRTLALKCTTKYTGTAAIAAAKTCTYVALPFGGGGGGAGQPGGGRKTPNGGGGGPNGRP